jgi:hypothetical protein
LGVSNALAFDAENLLGVNLVDLLFKVTQRVIVRGFEFKQALEFTLKCTDDLGMHSNILHLSSAGVCKYIWAQKDSQPWGQRLSLQCPGCGVFNSWVMVYLSATKAYSVQCKNAACGKARKGERWSFQIEPPPQPRKNISVDTNSQWIKITL